MYIRWKKRTCKKWSRGTTYSAYLVQCERRDGKPRQKVLAFLGSVGEHTIHLHLNEVARAKFWRRALNVLAPFQFTEQEQAKIWEMLAQKVPPLSEEGRAQNHILTPRSRADVGP